MKHIQSLRKLRFPLIFAFGTMPLPMMLFSSHGQALLPYGWVYPAAYALLAAVSLFIKGKWRLLYGIAAATVSVGCGVFLPTGILRFVSAIVSVGYGILLLWSLKIGGWGKEEELPGHLYGILFALQLLGQTALLMNATTGNGAMVPYGASMKLSFFAFMLLALLSMNRRGLHEAAEKRQRISSVLYRKNRMLTLCLFGIALLVSLAPSAYAWVKQILLWIAALVLKLLMLFSRPQSGAAAEGGGGTGGMPMGEGAAPGAFALFMEKIVTFAAVAFIAFLGAVLLYRIGRALVKLLRILWARLERYAEHVSEDYIDEITDTRDEASQERIAPKGSLRRISQREQRNLSPAGKVRYRYLRLLLKHPQWTPGSTPREKLPRHLASIYERVRYGGQPVTEEEAAAFAAGIKQIE